MCVARLSMIRYLVLWDVAARCAIFFTEAIHLLLWGIFLWTRNDTFEEKGQESGRRQENKILGDSYWVKEIQNGQGKIGDFPSPNVFYGCFDMVFRGGGKGSLNSLHFFDCEILHNVV